MKKPPSSCDYCPHSISREYGERNEHRAFTEGQTGTVTFPSPAANACDSTRTAGANAREVIHFLREKEAIYSFFLGRAQQPSPHAAVTGEGVAERRGVASGEGRGSEADSARRKRRRAARAAVGVAGIAQQPRQAGGAAITRSGADPSGPRVPGRRRHPQAGPGLGGPARPPSPWRRRASPRSWTNGSSS